MQGAAKARRRARERRQTVGVLMTLALALIVSLVSWRLFFTAWASASPASAPSFALPSSTGQTVALRNFRQTHWNPEDRGNEGGNRFDARPATKTLGRFATEDDDERDQGLHSPGRGQ